MGLREVYSNNRLLWTLSLLLSILAVVVITDKWFQNQRSYGSEVNRVGSSQALEQFFQSKDTIEFEDGRQPHQVPTGFFIQSLAFVNASDVNITGYIWQKYSEDFPDNIEKGFIFPEEVNSNNTTLKRIYQKSGLENGKKYEMEGYYFDVTLRQSFDYSRYPLDLLTVWIRLWPKDFDLDTELIFTPDFNAYVDSNKKLFGLDIDIVQGEWEIDETFFSYNNITYDTDFGFFLASKEQKYKEFFINIGMKRKFINAFIINLVPLLVVAILLFAQMMIVTSSDKLATRFGFNTNGTIATASALFFVVLLAHIQVRQKFSGSGLVYIEYFYLIMYFVILMTALNAYLFTLGKLNSSNMIKYQDNLIPKLAYWPCLLWMMAIVTHLIL